MASWILSALWPVSVGVWALENVLVLIAIVWIAATFRRLPLSDLAYACIAVFLLMHEVGAHYTYEKVPFGAWLKPVFGLSRNDYDRIVHFAFGLLLYLPTLQTVRPFVRGPRLFLYFEPILILSALSAFYEIAEAYANLVLSPFTAAAYLSMQGDMFDSENDMASALLGSLLCALLVTAYEFRKPLSS